MIARTATNLRARPLWAVVTTVSVTMTLLLQIAPPLPARADVVDTDPAVLQARERLAAGRERAAALARELDAAAGAFERADAHRLRLLDEVAAHDGAVDQADAWLDEARAAFADSVAESYRAPGASASLLSAVAGAPDAATALHRAALMRRLTVQERMRAARAAAVRAQAGADARQHQVVRLGVTEAAETAADRADVLTALLASARGDADAAAAALSDAERAVRTRIEEEERARAARALAARVALATKAAQAAQAARAVVSDGSDVAGGSPFTGAAADLSGAVGARACPIGAPNGFIDSWGFPRSGGRSHKGVDIFAVHGMPLYAVADGTITRVYSNRLGGLSIDLVDEAGNRYYYAHLSSAAVTGGARVRAGEVIGANGNSGNARTTPPHLHWQYHPGGGEAVNPYPLAVALCR